MRITNKFLTPPRAKRRRLRKKSNGKKISRPPQARKHCRNGGPDTDGNWDKVQKKRKTEKGKKARKTKEAKKTQKSEGNYSKYINIWASLRAHATRHGEAVSVAREQSRGNRTDLTLGSWIATVASLLRDDACYYLEIKPYF